MTQHSRDEEPQVRAPKPQRATGDMPDPLGFAKASPFVRKIKDSFKPKSKEQEADAIKKSTIQEVTEEEQDETKDSK